MKTNTNNNIAFFLFAVYLAVFSQFVMKNPVYYWDIVPYVASTLKVNTDDPIVLHQATFELLEAELSQEQFRSLFGAGGYTDALYADPIEFYHQLDMYLNKPLYVNSLRLLYVLGVNPVDGLLIVALLPAIGILLLLFIWLKETIQPLHALALVVIFATAARLTDITQGLVHNNLSSFCILLAVYLLTSRRNTPLAMVACALAVLTRTENIIFIGLTQLFLCWQYVYKHGVVRSQELIWRCSGFLVSIVIYLTISITFDQQWWRLFYHSLIESQTDILNFSVAFSISTYFDVVLSGIRDIFAPGVYMATVLPVFILILLVSTPANKWSQEINEMVKPSSQVSNFQLVLIALLVIIAYLFLFPLVLAWDRFFTHFYALFTVCAVNLVVGSINQRKAARQASTLV